MRHQEFKEQKRNTTKMNNWNGQEPYPQQIRYDQTQSIIATGKFIDQESQRELNAKPKVQQELFDPRSLYKVKDNSRNKGQVSRSLALSNKQASRIGFPGGPQLGHGGLNEASGATLFRSKLGSQRQRPMGSLKQSINEQSMLAFNQTQNADAGTTSKLLANKHKPQVLQALEDLRVNDQDDNISRVAAPNSLLQSKRLYQEIQKNDSQKDKKEELTKQPAESKARLYKLKAHELSQSIDLPDLSRNQLVLQGDYGSCQGKYDKDEIPKYINPMHIQAINVGGNDESLMQIQQLSPRSLKRIGSGRNMGNHTVVKKSGRRYDKRFEKEPSQSSIKIWGVDTPVVTQEQVLPFITIDQQMKASTISSIKKESSKAILLGTPNYRSPQIEEALHVGPVPQVTSKVLNLRKHSVKKGWQHQDGQPASIQIQGDKMQKYMIKQSTDSPVLKQTRSKHQFKVLHSVQAPFSIPQIAPQVKNPHNEPYQKHYSLFATRRKASTFQSNADMMHVLVEEVIDDGRDSTKKGVRHSQISNEDLVNTDLQNLDEDQNPLNDDLVDTGTTIIEQIHQDQPEGESNMNQESIDTIEFNENSDQIMRRTRYQNGVSPLFDLENDLQKYKLNLSGQKFLPSLRMIPEGMNIGSDRSSKILRVNNDTPATREMNPESRMSKTSSQFHQDFSNLTRSQFQNKHRLNRSLILISEENQHFGIKLPEIGLNSKIGIMGPHDPASFRLLQNSSPNQLEHNQKYNAYYPQSLRKSQQQLERLKIDTDGNQIVPIQAIHNTGNAKGQNGVLKQTLDMSLKDSRYLDLALVAGSALNRLKQPSVAQSGESARLVGLADGINVNERRSIYGERIWTNRQTTIGQAFQGSKQKSPQNIKIMRPKQLEGLQVDAGTRFQSLDNQSSVDTPGNLPALTTGNLITLPIQPLGIGDIPQSQNLNYGAGVPIHMRKRVLQRNLLTSNKNNPVQLKSQKQGQQRKEQQLQMARNIVIKNSMIQKQNFNYFLKESIDLKESNLPYTKLQFMSIIENHRDQINHGHPAGPSHSQRNQQLHNREFAQMGDEESHRTLAVQIQDNQNNVSNADYLDVYLAVAQGNGKSSSPRLGHVSSVNTSGAVNTLDEFPSFSLQVHASDQGQGTSIFTTGANTKGGFIVGQPPHGQSMMPTDKKRMPDSLKVQKFAQEGIQGTSISGFHDQQAPTSKLSQQLPQPSGNRLMVAQGPLLNTRLSANRYARGGQALAHGILSGQNNDGSENVAHITSQMSRFQVEIEEADDENFSIPMKTGIDGNKLTVINNPKRNSMDGKVEQNLQSILENDLQLDFQLDDEYQQQQRIAEYQSFSKNNSLAPGVQARKKSGITSQALPPINPSSKLKRDQNEKQNMNIGMSTSELDVDMLRKKPENGSTFMGLKTSAVRTNLLSPNLSSMSPVLDEARSRSGCGQDASKTNWYINIQEPDSHAENFHDQNDEQNSKLRKKNQRQVIGEMAGGLLELTPWHEDALADNRDRDSPNKKGYIQAVSGVGGAINLTIGNDQEMKPLPEATAQIGHTNQQLSPRGGSETPMKVRDSNTQLQNIHAIKKVSRKKWKENKLNKQMLEFNQSLDNNLVLLQNLENLDENQILNYHSDFDDEVLTQNAENELIQAQKNKSPFHQTSNHLSFKHRKSCAKRGVQKRIQNKDSTRNVRRQGTGTGSLSSSFKGKSPKQGGFSQTQQHFIFTKDTGNEQDELKIIQETSDNMIGTMKDQPDDDRCSDPYAQLPNSNDQAILEKDCNEKNSLIGSRSNSPMNSPTISALKRKEE